MVKIKTEKTIAIAHLVHMADKKSPCRRLHGHNIKIIVEIDGKIKYDGMVVDFRHIKAIINELDHRTVLPQNIITRDADHYIINTEYSTFNIPINMCYILPIPAVTAECLAEYLCKELKELLDDDESIKITVYESEKSYAQSEA